MGKKSENWCDACEKPTDKFDSRNKPGNVIVNGDGRQSWSLGINNWHVVEKDEDAELKAWLKGRELDIDLCAECALKAVVAVKAVLGLEKK